MARLVVEAVAATLALGAVALALRAVTVSGFAAGVGVGLAIYLGLGRAGFGLLALFFVLGSALTRLGYRRKQALGAAQAGSGARSAWHVLGKGLVAAGCGVLAGLLDRPAWCLMAFVAALGAGLGDTVATELGTLAGRRFWLLPRLRAVPAGTPGAVSLEGTLLGAGGALLVAFAATAAGLAPNTSLYIVPVAAVVAGLWESVERRILGGFVPAHLLGPLLNFDLTFTAALLGVVGLWVLG